MSSETSPPEMPLIARDLSWLSFSDRVLQEAGDPSNPLFERLAFLSIFSSNLDEFFRVRVGHWRGLQRLAERGVAKGDGSPVDLLQKIHAEVLRQQYLFGATLREHVLPELAEHGIRLVDDSQVDGEGDAAYLEEYFQARVLPHLGSFVLERGHRPFLKNRRIYLVVELRPTEDAPAGSARPRYGMVEVPSPPLDRFVTLPADRSTDERRVIFLDDVIRLNLGTVFPGWRVGDAYALKLSRDADLKLDGGDDRSLVEALRQSLPKRETGAPTRFLHDPTTPDDLILFLEELFELEDDDRVVGGRYHNLHDLRSFPRFGKRELSFEPWPAAPHPELERADSMLDAVAERDRLLHFPYQSYEYVVRFLEEAANDPDVEEIWLTVYRVSRDSAVLGALVDASERGKKVRVFVEVQARFDEESNLYWAERMEEAGIVTMYSIPGIKVHAKIALVIRREAEGRRGYAYLGTGNFNEVTSRFYTDVGLLTADARIADEVELVFRHLSGEEPEPRFQHLLVAPFSLRERCCELIDGEIDAARSGQPASITVKLNALEDPGMVAKLYEASRGGVDVRLIVRGIFCLVPGVPGWSERIEARSIVDRYLEHWRAYVFHAGGEERMYLASADWMQRNLNRRVEVAFPLYDPEVRRQAREALELQWRDNVKARILDAEQTNGYVATSGPRVRAQAATRDMVASLADQETSEGAELP